MRAFHVYRHKYFAYTKPKLKRSIQLTMSKNNISNVQLAQSNGRKQFNNLAAAVTTSATSNYGTVQIGM